MRPDPARWLPKALDVTQERVALGRVAPLLYRVRDPGALVDATDEASFGSDERFPYWSELWPSGIALARHLARGGLLSGLEAMELGCGTGLAGVVAALRGARVTFTDYERPALAFARANHELNLGRPGAARLLDWRDPPRRLSADLVIASDVLYEARFLLPFLGTLKRLLRPGGRAVVAEPGRRIAEGAVESLEEAGFRRRLTLEEFTREGKSHSVWIHVLTRPKEVTLP